MLSSRGISFHPTKPSILAGGTYNGELQIWSGTQVAGPKRPVSPQEHGFGGAGSTGGLLLDRRLPAPRGGSHENCQGLAENS